jgi:hypothetical protein
VIGGTLAFAGTLAGCASSSPSSSSAAGSETGSAAPDTESSSASPNGSTSVLLAYFSRPGENYYYGDRIDLEVGNTEVLAGMIAERLQCDTYRIEADDPYSDDYDATVARNTREQGAEARPAIAKPLPALDGYNIVLLASPIWGSTASDDHEHIRRILRLREHHCPLRHYSRHEWAWHSRARLHRSLPRRDHGSRPGRPGRRGQSLGRRPSTGGSTVRASLPDCRSR